MNTSDLKQEFTKAFDTKPERVFFSPGRINLIGEHTDYNGGHVFPCAITIGTYGVYAPRTDTTVRMYSANIPDAGVVTFDVNDLSYDKAAGWTNYPKGMMDESRRPALNSIMVLISTSMATCLMVLDYHHLRQLSY